MAKLDDTQRDWAPGITRIEETDRVLGGDPAKLNVRYSPVNYALQEVVSRLNYLRDAVEGIVIPVIRAATVTIEGVIRIATQSEVNAGVVDNKAVTPETLQAKLDAIPGAEPVPIATTTVRGIVEKLTKTEALALTDNERYLTTELLKDILRESSGARASTTYRGVVERLTNSEAQAGLDGERYASIANVLHALRNGTLFQASDSVRGVVERLTTAEARSATDNTRYLTIALALDAIRNSGSFAATTTRRGSIEIATQAEANAGTAGDKALVPNVLAEAVGRLIRTHSGSSSTSVTTSSGNWITVVNLPSNRVFLSGSYSWTATRTGDGSVGGGGALRASGSALQFFLPPGVYSTNIIYTYSYQAFN